MSRFLDQLERIGQNTPAPLGFGVSRAERTPGMALVGLISGNHADGCAAAESLGLEGVILSGIEGPAGLGPLKDSLPSAPWGARSDSLTADDVNAYQEAGGDLLVFDLDGTQASAVTSDDLARVLCVEPDLSTRQVRGIDSLPVDVLLVDMVSHSGGWSLADVARVAGVSRRVDKYVLLHLSEPPAKADLEAVRNVGVHGLVLDIGSVSREALEELKANLLDMPRQRPRRRDRASAVVPSSVFPSGGAPGREDEEEEPE